MAKPFFLIEESGFTVADYHKLKSEGKSDPFIYDEILFVSRTAFQEWKKRHDLLGYSVRGQYKKYQRRDKYEMSVV